MDHHGKAAAHEKRDARRTAEWNETSEGEPGREDARCDERVLDELENVRPARIRHLLAQADLDDGPDRVANEVAERPQPYQQSRPPDAHARPQAPRGPQDEGGGEPDDEGLEDVTGGGDTRLATDPQRDENGRQCGDGHGGTEDPPVERDTPAAITRRPPHVPDA